MNLKQPLASEYQQGLRVAALELLAVTIYHCNERLQVTLNGPNKVAHFMVKLYYSSGIPARRKPSK